MNLVTLIFLYFFPIPKAIDVESLRINSPNANPDIASLIS